MSDDDPPHYPIMPGRMYGRRRDTGRYEEIPATANDVADAWICRRIADYPPGRIPPDGARARCAVCGQGIIYNPEHIVNAPKICQPCAGIEPGPL